jgi:hypothetical protein
MKYVLLFCADGEEASRFESLTGKARAAQFAKVGAWFAAHASRIKGGKQLAHPKQALLERRLHR